jgi:hypothetical protein
MHTYKGHWFCNSSRWRDKPSGNFFFFSLLEVKGTSTAVSHKKEKRADPHVVVIKKKDEAQHTHSCWLLAASCCRA